MICPVKKKEDILNCFEAKAHSIHFKSRNRVVAGGDGRLTVIYDGIFVVKVY